MQGVGLGGKGAGLLVERERFRLQLDLGGKGAGQELRLRRQLQNPPALERREVRGPAEHAVVVRGGLPVGADLGRARRRLQSKFLDRRGIAGPFRVLHQAGLLVCVIADPFRLEDGPVELGFARRRDRLQDRLPGQLVPEREPVAIDGNDSAGEAFGKQGVRVGELWRDTGAAEPADVHRHVLEQAERLGRYPRDAAEQQVAGRVRERATGGDDLGTRNGLPPVSS